MAVASLSSLLNIYLIHWRGQITGLLALQTILKYKWDCINVMDSQSFGFKSQETIYSH